jgi:CRISPR-associated protein Cmr4
MAMKDFRVGYLYSLSPIHCGGEGDLGNILDIVRESHTGFPYIPGSSLRGGIRGDMTEYVGSTITDRLFGQELSDSGQMGVHQVWFGDGRLLWVPMRTMSAHGSDVFMWVSCPTLLRDHALLCRRTFPSFPNDAVGDRAGLYTVADAKIQVQELTDEQKTAIDLAGNWTTHFKETESTWKKSRIVLPDSDFQVLMEHALWTQIRNKIQESGGAEVFWTDVCIPRDTILYYGWGYAPQRNNFVEQDHDALKEILTGLFQVGGQANVGRGWVQGWIANEVAPQLQNSAALISSGQEK